MRKARRSSLWGKSFVFFVVIGVVLVGGSATQGNYGGGTGEPNDPYQIWDANHMQAIGVDTNDWDKCFILMADIDLSQFTGTEFNVIGGSPPFAGVFDGNDRRILNLTCGNTDGHYVGLFGYVRGEGAEIRDLGLVKPNVSAETGMYTGPLVCSLCDARVIGCYTVDVNVSGVDGVGGLIGNTTRSEIVDCYSSGTVVGVGSMTGGLVGKNYRTKIATCYSEAEVSGDENVGGLVGRNYGPIVDCYARGSVTGEDRVGGLIGLNSDYGVGHGCYATGSVSGTGYYSTGGLIGSGDISVVTSCFWSAETSGQTRSAGGTEITNAQMQDPNTFMGAGWDFVDKPDGPADIWAEPDGGGYPILYWQMSPLPPLPVFSGGTGEPASPYLIGSSTQLNSIGHNPRLMNKHYRLTSDIDLIGSEPFLIGSKDYPFTGVFDGDGFKILNFDYACADIDYVGLFRYVQGENAAIKNLGMANVEIEAVNGSDVGSLVGYMYYGTISNCHITDCSVSGKSSIGGLAGYNAQGNINECFVDRHSIFGDYCTGGLVGQTDRPEILGCHSHGSVSGDHSVGGLIGGGTGQLTDCHSVGTVTGTYCVGGFIGRGRSHMTNCYSAGTVIGGEYTGGLCGSNHMPLTSSYSISDVFGNIRVGGLTGSNKGIISQCFSSGSVLGGNLVGGLVGENEYHILDSYSIGSANGSDVVGGLVGNSFEGYISYCYSRGDVNGVEYVGGLVGSNTYCEITNSYWDIETSGEPNMCGEQWEATGCDPNNGRTTAEMHQQSTFTNWDFINVWNIGENQTYPYLRTVPAADINHDRIVNLFDFAVIADQWMNEQ